MDYAPVALQATDVLVDKHFHKIPNKAFDKSTYKPRFLSRSKRRGREQDREKRNRDSENVYDNPEVEEPDDEEGYQSEPERNTRDIPRHSGQAMGVSGYPYRSDTPPMYSQQPPRVRPEYLPKYPQVPPPSDYYFPPPPIAPYPDPRPSSYGRDDLPRRDRAQSQNQDDRYSDSYRASPRRPKPIARRSSYDDLSVKKPYRNDYDDDDRRIERRKAKSSSSEHGKDEGLRDKAHRYGLKDELKDMFTDSGKGLAGGAIGALVGGWATDKFQEAQTGKGDSERGNRSKLITLFGAAAGGLVANAVVEKWQEGQEKTDEKQKKWDDKWDEGGHKDGNRKREGNGSGEKEKRRGDRERRDSVRSRDQRRDDSWDRERRDSIRSKDQRRDDSWDRHMAYDERTSRRDGRGYEGPNDGYY